MFMEDKAKKLGEWIKRSRKAMGATQKSLALTSGTGLRFIIDLEKGKPTCQIGKALIVLHTLGVKITLASPAGEPFKL
jgi:y4mF family transcriptional regulator